MAETLLMPTLGLTMTEGTVDQWYKSVGDTVTKGEPVVSISSEKLTHDVESPVDGVLLSISVEAGGEAPCQAVIGYVGNEGETISEATEIVEEVNEIQEDVTQEMVKDQPTAVKKEGERIFATPLARKLAADKHYSLSDIIGTGGNGRITRRDVERHVPQVVSQSVISATVGEGLEGMRKVIAQRMHQSLAQTAQLTLHRKANITSLLAFRKDMKEKAGDSLSKSALSINTLLIKAVSLALKDFPQMNASYDTQVYTEHKDVHIGVAVAVDDGLVVPVVKDVHLKSLSQIGSDFVSVTSQAVDGSLASEFYRGSTFTITNLGNAGVEYFTPILNTPEIGILGIGVTSTKLVFNEEKDVTEISELPLSLTFDHQVLDGSPAAEFLGQVVYYLEHPYSLVI
ncbi:dihydrolipoamide acetyltransferase family protein [Vagococcus bubulae]|uniref:Dihydrolipoamide acetyltransferase component of pyruvate dehydrogenase complex n=1 Tax=Vagococcus bubulae TaxID=1977868 RepID=A0A429ZL88_9ENTE|nr:dihydrolipoamide acetyltransferase family protein [Vagococcus bubulae]RST94467.1 branched-chain alpha-keto acid dehydrogenase subunit E2 [Vagococcus bubulae]